MITGDELVKVVLKWVLEGANMLNVLYLRNVEAKAMQTVADDLDTIFSDWWTGVSAQFSNTTRLDTIEVFDWSVLNGTYGSVAPALVGTSANDPVPANVATCVSLLTPFIGRSRRGRMYLGGLTETAYNGSQLTPTALTALSSNMSLLLGDLVVNSTPWVIASFVTNGAPRPTAFITEVSGWRIDSRADSQRRRLPNTWT